MEEKQLEQLSDEEASRMLEIIFNFIEDDEGDHLYQFTDEELGKEELIAKVRAESERIRRQQR